MTAADRLERMAEQHEVVCGQLAQSMERIAELEAALRNIAAPTYGTEMHDTDAERADVYWGHIVRFQKIARGALN